MHHCHHQRWQRCPGSALGPLFCCTASSCGVKTPSLGAAVPVTLGTSARLEKQPGVEPVGNPKYAHPDPGQQEMSWLSAERMEWWEGELPLLLGPGDGAMCISFLLPLEGCMPSSQPCGALCGTPLQGLAPPLCPGSWHVAGSASMGSTVWRDALSSVHLSNRRWSRDRLQSQQQARY